MIELTRFGAELSAKHRKVSFTHLLKQSDGRMQQKVATCRLLWIRFDSCVSEFDASVDAPRTLLMMFHFPGRST